MAGYLSIEWGRGEVWYSGLRCPIRSWWCELTGGLGDALVSKRDKWPKEVIKYALNPSCLVFPSFYTQTLKKNWHCNPNMSLILPQEAFFHKGISSVSLEENIILSSNMLSNKVAPISVCWFKSVSGYADTVSAACKPQPAHMFWMWASDWIWLLWLLFGKYLPACRAGRHRLATGEKKKKEGKDQRMSIWRI